MKLLSREEMACVEDMGDYFRVPPELRDLNYGKYAEQGEEKISRTKDYNSHNTQRLHLAAMQTLLWKLTFMPAITRGENVVSEE
jgi:UDP-N-acetylglucosamine 4,6-dehydratase